MSVSYGICQGGGAAATPPRFSLLSVAARLRHIHKDSEWPGVLLQLHRGTIRSRVNRSGQGRDVILY